MKPWKVVALLSLPMLLFAAWRVWSIYKERNAPITVKQQPAERPHLVVIANIIGNYHASDPLRKRMRGKTLDRIRGSLTKFVDAAQPQDRVAVMTFADTPRWDVPFSAHPDEVREAIRNLSARGRQTRSPRRRH